MTKEPNRGDEKTLTMSVDDISMMRDWLREEAKKGWFLKSGVPPQHAFPELEVKLVYTGQDYTQRQRATGELKDQFELIDKVLAEFDQALAQIELNRAQAAEEKEEATQRTRKRRGD